MLTHAIQSDIVMICARVMQRKNSDKKKRVSCYDFCINISLVFDLFSNDTITFTWKHIVNTSFVLQIPLS